MGTNYNPVERVWSGPIEATTHHPYTSVGKFFETTAKKNYCNVAQIFEPTGQELSYKKIHKMSMKMANFFHKMGLTQNDVVGICASNTPNLASIVFGAFLAAIPISTLDPSFDKDGIKHVFGITQPKS
ncbi:hypothetical protein ACFFRR_001581 [Megaselia abdita]